MKKSAYREERIILIAIEARLYFYTYFYVYASKTLVDFVINFSAHIVSPITYIDDNISFENISDVRYITQRSYSEYKTIIINFIYFFFFYSINLLFPIDQT